MNAPPARRRPLPLPLQYSAEILRSDGDESKVHIDGSKTRVEQTVAGVTTIAIWRPDLGRGYSIEADTGMYSMIPITPDMETVASGDVEEDVEWEYVATEPFGSRTVNVFDVFGKGDARRRSRVYVDSETHIRWKEVTFNKLGRQVLVIETRNVEIGPPPASVFELPPGLQEVRLR